MTQTWASPNFHDDGTSQSSSNELRMGMNLEMHPTMVDPVETAEEPTSSLSLSSPTSNLATQSNIRLNRDLSRLLPLVSVRRPSQGSAQPILSLASRFLQKATTPLQLPSYERLGISSSSSPTTDSSLRPCSADCSVPKPGSSFVSNLSSQAHTVHTRSYSASETDDSLPPLGAYQQSLPLTPPADYDERHLDWNPTSSFPAIEVCKSKHNYPPQVLLDENNYNTRTSSPGGRGSSDSSGNSDSISAAMSSNPTSMMQNLHIHQSQHEKGNWLEDIIETMLSCLAASRDAGDPVRLVAHTLPYPHSPHQGGKTPTSNTVFRRIVEAIQNRLQPGQSPYINITHAVPEQFPLSNLPASPASTSRLQAHGGDYVSSTVFSSATPVPSYHSCTGADKPRHYPSIIVPPGSVHISILDRYLPPSSVQEFQDLFDHRCPSPLIDRLSEISTRGGCLLFIYPTKKGATTFKTGYLDPILDPVLRHMVVLRGLSADIGRDLGQLAAVSEMDDFETMQEKVQQLCDNLSTTESRFFLVNSGIAKVSLDRSLWAEWYLDQERPRMKEILNKFWQNSRRTSGGIATFSSAGMLSDKDVSPSSLLRAIDEGIRKRPYGDDTATIDGVELGLFVIKRRS